MCTCRESFLKGRRRRSTRRLNASLACDGAACLMLRPQGALPSSGEGRNQESLRQTLDGSLSSACITQRGFYFLQKLLFRFLKVRRQSVVDELFQCLIPQVFFTNRCDRLCFFLPRIPHLWRIFTSRCLSQGVK